MCIRDSVYAGKTGLTINSQAAAAAHTGSVYHDRVHADDGFDAFISGHIADDFHHDQRTNRDNSVVFDSGIELFFECCGNKAFVAITAVIGHDKQIGAGIVKFFLRQPNKTDKYQTDTD